MARANSNHPREQKRRFWQEHLTAWQEADISQAEYCRRNEISSRSFSYWKKKQPQKRINPVSFVPVPIAPAMAVGNIIGGNSLCLLLGERYRVEVGDDFSPLTLQKLVRVLEEM